ncbi:Glutamate-1-semialdehyde aminotransferase [Ignavibacterium album JCM 16511]|uniref:Glutamate-1-semialdehyde aminotransferase n=1 Tax=Ignavibacterium album (strain DSM 19864 / JCM 16511 / NBRC 101810 / Mat9-16) TaxID=945713 RepID=I0AJS2_IGNAJ|nr:aminotransferase class III-fold pyridoxal phosphate-dependent enzyme [Ignavibacterium album]AFH49229.1 Glutamate-1-semialdehyde aminotransferase [Ignavibacterium album JCM 16511]
MPNKVEFNKDYPVITKSDEYYKIALELIPAQTQTLAKGPGQNIKGVAPKYLQRGKGSHVWDVDGNEYLDYTMAVGPLSLGYAYDKVDDAIREQLKDGITFSLMHPLEVEVAQLINKVVPNAESIRYSKVGADVTTAAVRLARAYTGRNKVLCCGYHGWHDWYIAVTDRNKGIPQSIQDLSYTFNYNDIQSVIDSIDEDTACVILEPFVFEEPKDNFLHKLRDICTENGTLLIFDEMWTGFRVAVGGAQEYFGVKADLACFSKAVANGMPISILTGKKEIMQLLEKDVFFFTTFGGEALSLAAVKATVTEIIEKNVPAYLAKQGRKLKDGYNTIANKLGMDYTKCSGFDCRTIITFDAEKSGCNPLEMKSLVQQEMIKRGILWGGFHNMSFSHTDDDIDYTLKAYEDVLPILKKAVEEKNVKAYLRGEPVEPVFRRVGNFNMKPKVKK